MQRHSFHGVSFAGPKVARALLRNKTKSGGPKMPRTAAKFTQSDLARAIRAVEQAGVDMDVILEPDGRIRITRAAMAAEAQRAAPVDYAGEIDL